MWWNIVGTVASVLSLAVSTYVLVRELRMAREVHELKAEEEQWHNENTK